MGAGIYVYKAVDGELNNMVISAAAEVDPIDRLINRGQVLPAAQAGRTGVAISWMRSASGRQYLLVGRYALLVAPLTFAKYKAQQMKGRPVDPRPPVKSPAAWFIPVTIGSASLTVDVYNTEVLALRKWTP